LDDIHFIEGLKNYVLFYCEKNKIVTLQNLKDLSDQLPLDRFIRVHKSYIVNLNFIEQVEGHSILIQDKRIPIGSSYRSIFFELIKNR
jgi:two-component system LytT family response regulator